MEDYRKKRNAEGAKDSTVYRKLSVMRSALYKGKRRTPPKVNVIPYFPLVKETNVRKGFLRDERYTSLRDAWPDELKPMFVTGFVTGMRLGEILAIKCRAAYWLQWKFPGFHKGDGMNVISRDRR